MTTSSKPARKTKSPQRDARFAMVIKPFGEVSRGTTVRFGGVTVVTPKPAENVVNKQIAEGRRAASKLKKARAKPGVTIRKSAGTPVFRADPRDATLIVQRLNGKSTRGRFVAGQFVPISSR
jgi:hypothetical protein